ncbi:DUF4430 domain-containing protein [Sunxiuqinia elliptica]|uniref:Transcobalamin-like C-terminal domain-containing protein n=1 Tax=Sunxiuqinia elliptica TaxID=655355 RepID=A0A1I2BM75_9BACT|nr:DUF4430 domain-containing protein [Sunxiuqinia elliptica]SFE56373.1 protein of unknown function [Sunxiuqinia elliptica]
MKLFLKVLVLVALFLVVVSPNSVVAKSANKAVTVEINFGDDAPLKSANVSWESDLTALEALMHVVEVSTHAVGEYVFVSKIDQVKGVPTKYVWYYKINGQSPKKLAINQKLKKGDVVTWIYKQDVCSDKKCK